MSIAKKIIHIHAKCNSFEIFEITDEKKAVKKLQTIKNNFIYSQKHFGINNAGNLVVNTVVVNPTLF